jgi:DNA repair ATPase RecN
MGDIAVENYQKNVSKYLDIWAKEAARIGNELKAVNAELDKLEALQNPGPDDKKRIEELKKKRENCYKQMDAASMELRVNLMSIQVPPTADEDELKRLPGRLKEIIKKKGVPLGKVVITPDVEFDFKAKKLKKLGITIKW